MLFCCLLLSIFVRFTVVANRNMGSIKTGPGFTRAGAATARHYEDNGDGKANGEGDGNLKFEI